MNSSSQTSPPLVVEGVRKQFRRSQTAITALNEVDLTAEAGQFIVIMGASGSGKSTLLHAIAGLTDVDAGKVLVNGQDLSELSDVRLTKFRGKEIGLVFQAFNLIPSLTAEDNIRLPAPASSHLSERVDQLLKRLNLQDRRLHKPGALSGGEQQRVAIARALICDPAILLADEPTGSLDYDAGQQICQLLHELSREQGRTIIAVTHEPNVAMWADRVVVMRDGKNVAEFTPDGSRDPQEVAMQYQSLLRRPMEAV
ncbi:peptide ABC transporter ATP-binding protein [Blastopirellula marina]|uniref:Peptide ABC transporter ATP-binding protein n=1 Tax=Blastopirellula marina TaxID=124 RepID=A0A2S8F093_9BACT|nr:MULTISPECIES: ABC transporter ATP-binding protein [Pirellulaceae]PQO25560.1 peptide ABC transporter ATP-binding protein [Blastopirellula marina]RCS42524.1 ABC transporter ATP-binding protein [Bremerella cremea]